MWHKKYKIFLLRYCPARCIRLKVASFESSLLKGEARRILYNFTHPPSCESSFKIPQHLVHLLAIWILIPNGTIKIHRAVVIGKNIVYSHWSQLWYRHHRVVPYIAERSLSPCLQRNTTYRVTKVHCAIGNSFQICSKRCCQQLDLVHKRPLTELCALLAIRILQ
jgi:hypothetical protein